MNTSDIKLISILLFVFLSLFITFKIISKEGTKAKVYYEDKMVLDVDLKINKNYIVKGFNGEVEIEVRDNKIRVIKETSPYHLCSKQGFISKSTESIICLPNKIVIKIEDDTKLDGVVR